MKKKELLHKIDQLTTRLEELELRLNIRKKVVEDLQKRIEILEERISDAKLDAPAMPEAYNSDPQWAPDMWQQPITYGPGAQRASVIGRDPVVPVPEKNYVCLEGIFVEVEQ